MNGVSKHLHVKPLCELVSIFKLRAIYPRSRSWPLVGIIPSDSETAEIGSSVFFTTLRCR